MAIRFHIPRKALLVRMLTHPLGKTLFVLGVLGVTLGLGTFTYYYVKYSRLIDRKLSAGPFTNTSMIFAAPRTVSLGSETTAEEIAGQLRNSGYSESRSNRMGWYRVRPDGIEIFPGPDSYFDQEAGVIKIADGKVSQIISLRDNTERTLYLLEPELVTNLFDRNREKRRLVAFADIPKVLVNAVVSAEDKRFFQHAGFDPLRIIKSAYVDMREGRKAEGASTLSMQLARSFWLDQAKTWRRKAAEVLITLHLEQKLTKQEIFEYYANQIYMGRRGSFNIHGLGEAAQAYLGKDLRELTLPDAALLAGLIQRPIATNPFRWPDRARARRNVILLMMRDNGYITPQEYASAVTAPIELAPGGVESTDAPYFVDLINDELQERFQDRDFQANSYRIYSTLDIDLQRDAAEAVRAGLKEVDEPLHRRRRRNGGDAVEAQVALVALDPHTGEIKALVGGRDYGMSQLNHAVAKRQPGSVFKPFVYAAAMNTAVEGGPQVLTPVSTVVDEPTTFWFDDKPYEPDNFKHEFFGVVSLRQAMTKSLNVPTVKVAEMVGYDRVVDLARRAGMNLRIQPTPAVALGAYEVTPIEVAGAYTVFANQGVRLTPNWINMIRDQKGTVIYAHKPSPEQVLDPRVTYMMVNLLEEVLRTGTGAGVRSRGFVLPAAGKTGTSRDGWFAGFTSKLLCVVWVGFDDNRELGLEGARSALPIWTEFMKRAHTHREYRNVTPFEAPEGIVSVEVDAANGLLATTGCPSRRTEVFVAGTQPVEVCRLHGGSQAGSTQIAGWETPSASPGSSQAAARSGRGSRAAAARGTPSVAAEAPPPQKPREKKGLFRRLLDIFR